MMNDVALADPEPVALELPEAIAAAADAVGEAFHVAVTVWRRTADTPWETVETRRLADKGRPPTDDVDPQTLDQVAATGAAVFIQETGDPTAAVCLGRTQQTDYVGVLVVGLSPVEQIDRIVADAVSRERLGQQIHELHAENDSFAVQLTSDLEELTFLRSVVDRMGSAAGGGLVTMARQTLPVLNTSVRAETLVLLAAETEDRPVRMLHHVGAKVPAERLRGLVDRFGPDAAFHPIVRNWTADAVTPHESAPDEVRSLVLVPVEAAGKRYGWLAAINRAPNPQGGWESSWQLDSDEFGSGEATLMTTTAAILAMQAANLEMIREKEQILVSVVRSLVSAIEAKDEYTRGHSERVALFTRRLAEEMGYLDDESERIYLAALLHDVGKIGVSDATLKKAGKLTSEEYAEISKHPDEGWAILCDLQQLRYVLPGVLHHHERWDGRGYPDKLAGTDIPLDGRVMAVADAYDAMTSDRPYRPGMPTEKAEAIIREGAGVQWDPECVNAFFACLEDIHQIKRDYKQRERRLRKELPTQEERLELPHEVTGLPE